jgi:hypothetical protein
MLIPFEIIKIDPSIIFESEKKLESHLEAASLHHSKAITFLKEGEYEKAARNALSPKIFGPCKRNSTRKR